MNIKVGRMCCHYKAGENPKPGDLYTYETFEISDDYDRILKIAEYTEDDNPRERGLLVVYRQLYSMEDHPVGKNWARPLIGNKGFITPEIVNGKEVPRFRLLKSN